MAVTPVTGPTVTVYIGRKPLFTYLVSVVPLVHNPQVKEIHIVARGRGISRAVDLALILVERWFKNRLKIKEIKVATNVLKNPENRIDRVSEICLVLEKTG